MTTFPPNFRTIIIAQMLSEDSGTKTGMHIIHDANFHKLVNVGTVIQISVWKTMQYKKKLEKLTYVQHKTLASITPILYKQKPDHSRHTRLLQEIYWLHRLTAVYEISFWACRSWTEQAWHWDHHRLTPGSQLWCPDWLTGHWHPTASDGTASQPQPGSLEDPCNKTMHNSNTDRQAGIPMQRKADDHLTTETSHDQKGICLYQVIVSTSRYDAWLDFGVIQHCSSLGGPTSVDYWLIVPSPVQHRQHSHSLC